MKSSLASDFAQQVFTPLLPSSKGGGTAQTFLVVPGNGGPRWLLPASQPNLGLVLAAWSPHRWDSRVKWCVLRTADRMGCLSLIPGMTTSTVVGLDRIDWKALGWNSDTLPVAAVYLGTPGPSRKAVIHLLDHASGACQMIVKVPINTAARAAIVRETDVLVNLAETRFPLAPRLLSVDRERGISAQTVLPGVAGSRRLLPEYLQLLRSLRLHGEMTSIAEDCAPLQQQLRCSVGSDSDLAAMIATLSQLCDTDPLPAFWVHGDFAPWNLKHLSDGSAALLDWEDARRGGLPLQDAFHFLHIQDYLFGKRPTSHAQDLTTFARDLDLTHIECHKLEIAYLARSCMQRLTQRQPEHSAFLLDTLRVVSRKGERATAPSTIRSRPLSPRLKKAPRLDPLRMRSDLFSAVIAEFNQAELPYCILSGYEEYPDRIPSDVDLMVLPEDMPRVSTLLAQAADRCGARILQAIQHESSALYFVLAKDDGCHLGFLNPDCCSDYRIRGRLWLRPDAILAARRSFKNFYVPSVPDEFIYYLIKKVLKQSMNAGQIRRLHRLYQCAPHDCADRLQRFWPAHTADSLKQAVVNEDLLWFASNRELLRSELEASPPVEPALDGCISRLRSIATSMRRILQPTGMCVIVAGEDGTHVQNIATALQRSLEPAFRWTTVLPFAPEQSYPFPKNNAQDSRFSRYGWVMKLFGLAIKIRVARLRSTLTICAIERGRILPSGRHRRISLCTRSMIRPDIVVVLTSDQPATAKAAPSEDTFLAESFRGCPLIYLNAGLSMRDSVYQASRVILQWLSTRQVRRLNPGKGPSTPSEAPFSQDYHEPQCLEAD